MKYKKECVLCTTNIWDSHKGRLKKNSEYGEIRVRLDNGSVMTVGVCENHREPTSKELPLIMAKVHGGWMEEVSFGIGNESWVKDVGLKLTALEYAE